MNDDGQIVVVDLFAGAGGLSQGTVEAIIDHYRKRIGHETGLDPTDVRYDHPRVHWWLAEHVDMHAINHWEPAIETHSRNHPWATQYHAKIQELHPPDVVEPGTVDILSAGPKCTHFSTARGGKPVSEQKRASGWDVLFWVEMLRPDHLIVENVSEFRDWGPITDEGKPTRDGSIFERWVEMLQTLGYSVVYDDEADNFGVVLNAADYGEAQSRERLFILASRDGRPIPPEPTHCDDPDDPRPPRRPAEDIIDWSDLGTSLWTRDLENPRVQPLSRKTMARIAEGIRRHCDDRLDPLADALETIGPNELAELRETIVPAHHAPYVADAIDRPFLVRCADRPLLTDPYLVKYYGTSTVRPVDEPVDTITKDGNHHAVANAESFLLGQHGGSVARDVHQRPTPTVANSGAISMTTVETTTLVKPRNGARGDLHSNALYEPEKRPLHTVTAKNHDGHLVTSSLIHYSHGGSVRDTRTNLLPTVATEKGGAFAMANSYLTPLYSAFDGQRPRTRSLARPLMTVTANKGAPACLASPQPFLVEYYGNSDARSTARPLGTVTTKDRFALCVPEAFPWGLDVKYRMLEPRELKQAQGFPERYEIAGSTKKTVTAQIGNAVPVNLAKALTKHLLASRGADLSTFGGGIQADPDAEVPEYEEVIEADD